MSMNAEPKRLWLEALRSGEYRQGIHALHRNSTAQYCCLGVACEEAIKSGVDVESVPVGEFTKYDNATETLPPRVLKWLGVDNCDPSVITRDGHHRLLSELNDRGIPFSEIADLIEAQL